MPVHSSTVDWDELNSLTERKFLPKITDNIFRSNALFTRMPRMTVDGGTFISQPLLYAEGPGGTYSGTEALDAAETDQVTVANFAWKWYFASATIREQDELMNSGRQALAKLIRVQMQTMQKTMQNRLGQGLHSDASDPTTITGLRAMVTDDVVYGGISKTNNSWWQSIVDNGLATAPTVLSIPVMRTARGLVTEDNETTNMIITTQANYDLYYGMLQPQQRFADPGAARGGFTSLLFEGIPVVVDSHCPANFMYFLNTRYMSFISHSGLSMKLRPFMSPVNKPQMRTAYLRWGGNLTGSNCRYQAVLTSIVA